MYCNNQYCLFEIIWHSVFCAFCDYSFYNLGSFFAIDPGIDTAIFNEIIFQICVIFPLMIIEKLKSLKKLAFFVPKNRVQLIINKFYQNNGQCVTFSEQK